MRTAGLSGDELERVFPFHLTIDRDLRVVEVGRSLVKIMPSLTPGTLLSDHFTVTRPQGPLTYQHLRERARDTCTLTAQRHPLVLKGQIIVSESVTSLLFLGSPRITSADDLARLGLTISDFAVHDAIIDFLFLSHAQESALGEVRAMADRLSGQRAEVRDAHNQITTLYTASRVLADCASLEEALPQLVPALARALGCDAASAWLRSGEMLVCQAATPAVSQVPPLRLGHSRGMLASVFATGEPIWLPSGHGAGDGMLDEATVAQPPEPDAGTDDVDPFDPPTFRVKKTPTRTERPVCGLPVRSAGEVIGVIAFAMPTTIQRSDDLLYLLGDITSKLEQFIDHRQAAAEIASREAVLAAITATMPLGLCVLDGDRVLYANTQFAHLWGIPPLPPTRARLLPSALVARVIPADQALLGPFTGVVEQELRLADGRSLRLHTAPLAGSAGRGDGRLYLVEDVTERERTRAQLTTQSAELATARDAALASVRAKTEFLANVSHELRTPLGAVIGMTSVLRSMELPTTSNEVLDDIESAGQTLLRLVDDLLDESRISVNAVSIELTPFDLPGLVRTTATALEVVAAQRDLPLRMTLTGAPDGPLLGDHVRIRQVISNLIGNAIKFTVLGSVRVDVRCAEAGVNRTRLTIDVIDTGIGISAEQLERVFEPFTQVDSSTTRRFGGAGLGLSISRRLVALMGGTLSVSSTIGVGSTFTVDLVLDKAPEQRRFGQTERWAPVVVTTPSKPRHILLVEDNPLGQRATRMLLEQLGHQVVVVGDGLTALGEAARTLYDVVLMDCHLPVLDGFEATRRIRGLRAPHSQVPIIACTASVLDEDRRRCFEVGMDDVVLKPMTPADLRRVLDGLESPSSAPEVAPAHEPVLDPARLELLRELIDRRERPALGPLIELYCELAPAHVADVELAAASGDVLALRRAAHALRGMSTNVGAIRLASVCARIEQTAAGGVLADLGELRPALATTLTALAREGSIATNAGR